MEHQDDTPRADSTDDSTDEPTLESLTGPPGPAREADSPADTEAEAAAADAVPDGADAADAADATPGAELGHEPLPVAGVDGEPPPIAMTPDTAAISDTAVATLGMDEVRPAELQEFDLPAGDQAHSPIEFLSDVVLPITVELGRVSTRIRDLLQTGPGAVIQLERQTSDPVDVIAGGRLIARGEVVVVGQSMGVRITELVLPTERVK